MNIALLCFGGILLTALAAAVAAFVFKAKENKAKENSETSPKLEVPEVPPVRKTWVDVQVENLVNEVLQSIQQQPEKWTTWGVYTKGFGDKVTNFEYSDKNMGVVVSPNGTIKYHAFRTEKEEKQACWFEVPLTDYDTNRIQEAFVWLATTKSLDFLKAKKQPKQDLPDKKLPKDDASDKLET